MTKRLIERIALGAALIVAALAIHAWLVSHDEQQRLQSTLAQQKQVLDAADSRERARDATLQQTLAQIDQLKRTAQTPAQIVAELPKYLPLPQPITLVPAPNSSPQPGKGSDDPTRVVIPPALTREGSDQREPRDRLSTSQAAPAAPSTNHLPPSQNAAHAASSPSVSADVECGLSRAKTKDGLPAAQAGLPPLSPAGACSGAQTQRAAQSPPKDQSASAQRWKGGDSFPPEDDGVPAPSIAQPHPQQVARSPASATNADTPAPSAPSTPCASGQNCVAQIPAADLKPLYDYMQDCRSCKAQLAAAQQDKLDDAAKIAALTRERDAAVTAAKGGTFWRRLKRNALWFAIGAAAGYSAAKR